MCNQENGNCKVYKETIEAVEYGHGSASGYLTEDTIRLGKNLTVKYMPFISVTD